MANADAVRGYRNVSFSPYFSIPYIEHWVPLQMKSILGERPAALLECLLECLGIVAILALPTITHCY